jgi:4-amino-4-deoxy-L-arabinose transferase-like glycosyltransferase
MQHYASAVVFFATVAEVLLFWVVVPGGWTAEESPDYLSYYLPVAQNLRDGRGLVTFEGEPAVRYPPGFPLLLGGLFRAARWTGTSEELWIRGFTLLAMGSAAVTLYFLARMIVGSRGALGTLALWMTYPFNLWLVRQPNSEILFFPLFYTALLFVGKILWGEWRQYWTALGAGVFMGAAVLVRPIALFGGGFLVVALLALRWREGLKHWGSVAALILVGNLLVILPWELWVWQKTGQWIPVSSVGSEAMRDGLTCALVTKGYRHRLDVSPQIADIMETAVQQW